MNGLNTLMNDLKQNLINDINSSMLPVGIAYYIVKDVLNEVEKSYEHTLALESQHKQEQENEQKNVSEIETE